MEICYRISMQMFGSIKEKPIPTNPEEFASYATELIDTIQYLEQKVRHLESKRFGASSERFIDPNQPNLFNEVEISSDQETEGDDEEIEVGPYKKKKRKKKIDLSQVTNRSTTVHELSEEERICPCCNLPMDEIGEEKTEKLEVVPAELSVKEDIYKKYACKNKECDSKVKQAKVQPVAIPRIKATMGTLAFIAIQKYLYGLPLYRLEMFFSALGVTLSRYVMSMWMIKLANALKPIYLTLEENLLESNYVHIDETRLQVLREEGREAKTKSYAWVRTTGDPNTPPIVLFHYSPNRSAKDARELLAGFKGYVQSDDYEGYACALNNNEDIIRLLCWDHSRRYFKDAYDAIPKENRPKSVSEQVLKLISKLYKIERRIKTQSDNDKLKIRQKDSLETLDKIKALCEEKLPTLSSKSPTASAINYTLDNWELLKTYTTNPMLNISNSPAEQAIRPFVVGRKAWLFSNTPAGAEASMILYSIVITAKANGLNPYSYIKDTLEKLPYIEKSDDLAKLLPTRQDG